MPCKDEYVEAENRRNVNEKINKLTRMLCWLCSRLNGNNALLIQSNEELRKWWEDHQNADAIREARELAEKTKAEIKNRALAKLNRQEREALGITEAPSFPRMIVRDRK